jgi:hypothetical protein
MITDDMRTQIQAINANLSHTRVKKAGARYFRYDSGQGKTVEVDKPNTIVGHSMFPYASTAMAVDPSEVGDVQKRLRKKGLLTEFDKEGRPIITSTKQHDALAKAFDMKTGRDGYGHVDEHGQFQNSGRRRTDEMQAGRARIRQAKGELERMPDDIHPGAVDALMREYDIRPSEDNTG